MVRSYLTWLAGLFVLAGSGCSAPQRTVPSIGTQSIVEAAPRMVFDAAEGALIDAGFDIDRRSFEEGILTTRPVETDQEAGAAGGIHLSSRVRMRRIAEIQIRQHGSKVEAGCKVLIQEQTTRTHQLFSGQQSAHDTMSDTPIDRDAGTTSSQFTVWRTLRRDRAVERAILEGIAERTGQEPLRDR